MKIAYNNQRYRRVTRRTRGVLLWLGAISLLAGVHCGDPSEPLTREQARNPRDRFGRTYYIDGAGNWGFGVADIANGLAHAGYKGNIINYRWSPTLNPALDQTIGRPAAHAKGKALGREISVYLRSNPEAAVNIIALSAGTGVGIWACETVEPPAKIKDIVLLGSSLSSTYDVSTALSHISGGIYVYHSPNDMVLQGPVRTLGTIDGEMGVESAGTVGLHPRQGDRNRIHNIPWSPRYEAYGWTGAHTDATCEPFVRHVIAKIIITSPTDSAPLSEAESNHEQFSIPIMASR